MRPSTNAVAFLSSGTCGATFASRMLGRRGGGRMSHSSRSLPSDTAATQGAASPHDRRARLELIGLLALLLITLAASLLKGQDIFVFSYIMTVIYAVRRPLRMGRPWSELGIKPGFVDDLKRVLYLSALVAVILPFLPLGVAFLFGYGHELVDHITARLPVDVASRAGLTAVAGLLAVALVLTLVEELVYRVTIQERLSWFIGTPAAILATAVIFGLAHAVGTSGGPQVVLSDVAGVTLDGVVLGIIYAKTHNLAVTWATHYAADVVGLIVLVSIFRAI
jgi:membrane protease YdiL (CAAX protease family)